jgi:hypothetical protein
MKRYIRTAQQPTIPASQQVNRVGKYLSKHIDGVYKTAKDRNTYDLYVHFIYQAFPEYTETPPINELDILITITTYQNKIRVDTIELTPMERTLGFDLFSPQMMNNLEEAKFYIMKVVKKRVQKAYPDMIEFGF